MSLIDGGSVLFQRYLATPEALLQRLLQGGWNHLSLFKAPKEILSDWLRDQGADVWADLMLDDWHVSRFRGHLYSVMPAEHMAEVRAYVKQLAAQLKEIEGGTA